MHSVTEFFCFQYINQTGFRVCLKELYETKYDPLSVTYTVLSGKKNHQRPWGMNAYKCSSSFSLV